MVPNLHKSKNTVTGKLIRDSRIRRGRLEANEGTQSMGIAINAANLHVGGGVQVATSLINEISKQAAVAEMFDVLVSAEVARNLEQAGCDVSAFHRYEMCNVYGLGSLASWFRHKLRRYSTVFTIFGPLYGLKNTFVNVVGFAQPWIIYPQNEVYLQMGWVGRLKSRLKFTLQSFFFRRADRLIVEAPHVYERLRSMGWRQPIDVVSNCLSSIYREPDRWLPVVIPPSIGLKLGIICRDYPHKNLGILPKVKKILAEKHRVIVDFYVTLTDSEWRAREAEFRDNTNNIGTLTIAQCPSFYQKMDGVVFPSLLECFSATPLEALYMGLPVFASDREFVRDVCGEAVIYFDPIDPNSIAAAISAYFLVPEPERLRFKIDAKYLDASLRAAHYVEILREYTNLGR